MNLKKPLFIGYLTLGDGGLDYSLQAARALIEGGVNLLEIGIPFSDPIADGPVISQAMQRSLDKGTTIHDAIPFVQELRKHTQIPLVLFSYYNPLLSAGETFLNDAKKAGIDGMLIVDLSFEGMSSSILDPVCVVTPTTSDERLEKIVKTARGFIYYACQKGTTGMRKALPYGIDKEIARIKRHTSLPVVIGFGISNREMAAEAMSLADGFVVGSYFVAAMARKAPPQELKQMAEAIDPRRPL